jgi:hypothetical protein
LLRRVFLRGGRKAAFVEVTFYLRLGLEEFLKVGWARHVPLSDKSTEACRGLTHRREGVGSGLRGYLKIPDWV